MSEINFNALSRSTGIERSSSSISAQKNANKSDSSELDSAHFSSLPDFSALEEGLESEFAALRSRLESAVNSSTYPSTEAVDGLARMFAIGIGSRQ